MKKLILSFTLALVFSFSVFAQSTEWEIDYSHTNIGFTISHLVISDVTGRFQEYSGSVKTSGEDFEGAQVDITIKTASIFTDNKKRDDHLRSDDFFNAEKNPTITFKSKSFNKVADNKYKITGDFNMNGVNREVELDADLKGIVKDPWGGTRAGFKATTTIDRYDYDLKYNQALETGGFLIGKEVDIEINIQLKKK